MFNIVLFLVFAASFLSMTFIAVFSPRFPEPKLWFLNKLAKVANGWHLIKNHKKIVWILFLLVALQLVLSTASVILQFRVFDLALSIPAAIFLQSVGMIGIIIAITPANLGVGEAITVFSALAIGIAPAQSLSVAILGRVIFTVIMFILGPIFSYVLMKDNIKKENKQYKREK